MKGSDELSITEFMQNDALSRNEQPVLWHSREDGVCRRQKGLDRETVFDPVWWFGCEI